MSTPTERQLQVLQHIDAHQRARGYGPSVRWLVEVLAVASTNTVQCHLEALARKRLVARDRHVARSTRLTPAGVAALQSAARRAA